MLYTGECDQIRNHRVVHSALGDLLTRRDGTDAVTGRRFLPFQKRYRACLTQVRSFAGSLPVARYRLTLLSTQVLPYEA